MYNQKENTHAHCSSSQGTAEPPGLNMENICMQHLRKGMLFSGSTCC